MRRLRERQLTLLERERGENPYRPGGDLRVCLVYPNLYGVAMGNLGYQVVHRALNELPGTSCERAVMPEGPDLRRIERRGKPLTSLETGTPLGEFDVLAFSVTFELDYLNMVRVLESSGIPAGRTRRNRFHPVVVAGGAALTVNHEPLEPMVDGWFRGEVDPEGGGHPGERLAHLVEVLRELRGRGGSPEDRREALAPLASTSGGDRAFRTTRARGGPAPGFEAVGSTLMAPDAVFGATALVEICRGCPWRCSFCVAKDMYGSFRRASHESVLEYARSQAGATDRIGIIGAGISAYPKLAGLLAELRGLGFSASVSSLRLDRVDDALLDEVARHGQRTLTVAPESFSDRLEGVVDKSLDLAKIVGGLRRVGGSRRFEKVKMYMIAGLPGEVEEDHEVAFATAEELVADGVLEASQLEFSYSLLLPRPGTVLGRAELLSKAGYKRTRRFLEARAKRAGVGLKVESYRMAMLSDLFCRGDRGIGERLVAWGSATGGRDPFRLEEAEYRDLMAAVLANGPDYLETITPSSRDLARSRAVSV